MGLSVLSISVLFHGCLPMVVYCVVEGLSQTLGDDVLKTKSSPAPEPVPLSEMSLANFVSCISARSLLLTLFFSPLTDNAGCQYIHFICIPE